MTENREDLLLKPLELEIAKQTIEERTGEKVSEIKYLGGGSFSAFYAKNNHNEEFVVKFPKMAEEVVHKMHYEKCITDLISKYVSPHEIVTQTAFFKKASKSFKHPIAFYKYLSGNQIGKLNLSWEKDPIQMKKLAKLLGDFNSKLHGIDYQKHPEFKEIGDIKSGEDIKKSWFTNYENTKKKVFPILTEEEKKWSTKMFEDFLKKAEKINIKPVLSHGDFDDSNVLIQNSFNHLQVIDFEEISIGDPVNDFCVWLDHPYGEKFVNLMVENYTGFVDEHFLERIKFYNQRLPFIYFNFGIEKNDKKFIDWGRRWLKERMERL